MSERNENMGIAIKLTIQDYSNEGWQEDTCVGVMYLANKDGMPLLRLRETRGGWVATPDQVAAVVSAASLLNPDLADDEAISAYFSRRVWYESRRRAQQSTDTLFEFFTPLCPSSYDIQVPGVSASNLRREIINHACMRLGMAVLWETDTGGYIRQPTGDLTAFWALSIGKHALKNPELNAALSVNPSKWARALASVLEGGS